MESVTREERRADLANRWAEHQRAPFPPRLRALDVDGVDLVTLDADLAGWTTRRLAGGPRPAGDELCRCVEDLERLLSTLADGHERRHVERLRSLAALLAEDGR